MINRQPYGHHYHHSSPKEHIRGSNNNSNNKTAISNQHLNSVLSLISRTQGKIQEAGAATLSLLAADWINHPLLDPRHFLILLILLFPLLATPLPPLPTHPLLPTPQHSAVLVPCVDQSPPLPHLIPALLPLLQVAVICLV